MLSLEIENKKEIRTHYSGIVIFAAQLITVVTGMTFTLIVARTLSQDQYGAFGKINILVPYFTLLAPAVPFWVMRFILRNKEGAVKTGIAANMTVAFMVLVIYLGLAPIIMPVFGFGASATLYALIGLQLAEAYLLSVLEACLQAREPQLIGYGLLIGEITKLFFAYVFIIGAGWLLTGVLLSFVAAFMVKIIFYVGMLREAFGERAHFGYIKEWIKGSFFNIYGMIGERMAAILFLMVALFGGNLAVSYYQAALPIATIITYSSFLAFALYPKILSENKPEATTASLKLVLMFAFPMTAGLLVLPAAYLRLLQGEVYVPAEQILRILAIDSLILTLSGVFMAVLFGVEIPDENGVSLKKLVASKTFLVFSLPYINSLVTLPVAFYILTNFTGGNQLLITTDVVIISTIAHFITMLFAGFMVKHATKIVFPLESIGKYVLASIIMALVLQYVIPSPTRLISTLAVTTVATLLYFVILIILDKELRSLLASLPRKLHSLF